MKSKKPDVLYIITVLTHILIWGQSMMPKTISDAETAGVLELLGPIWDGMNLSGLALLTEQLARKLFGHFLEFGILGAELTLIGLRYIKRSGKTVTPSRFIFQIMNASLFVALIDETIQIFAVNRNPQVSDIWLDICGSIFGAGLTLLIRSLLMRREIKHHIKHS